ncbi:FAD-dependent oxidoreductase, partial [Burkholderia pseudomallei]
CDAIGLATGVTPRRPAREGIGHARVMRYLDVLRDGKPVGASVAVIGAGWIGFDVSDYLTHTGESAGVAPSPCDAHW